MVFNRSLEGTASEEGRVQVQADNVVQGHQLTFIRLDECRQLPGLARSQVRVKQVEMPASPPDSWELPNHYVGWPSKLARLPQGEVASGILL